MVGQRFWKYGQPLTPNPENQSVYNEKYQAYKALRSLYVARRRKK
jgi:hypothetical protein